MPTFVMRAYDPTGEAFEQWESTAYDTAGADYAGVPSFGTLINIHAAYIIADAATGGGAFTAENSAKDRGAPPYPEEAGAGNSRQDSSSDFGADVSSSADSAASTELP